MKAEKDPVFDCSRYNKRIGQSCGLNNNCKYPNCSQGALDMKFKLLKVADVKEYFSQLSREEITFSMFTQLLNEAANKALHEQGVPLLWNPYPSVRPPEYGVYFVWRAGKIHKETWNTSGWAYNENTITHWLRVSGPNLK